MQTLRKICFYIFAAAYVVVCPVIILYAFGFIVKPGETGDIVKTGLIYLSSAPSDAAVYINNKFMGHRTPACLRNLLPGDYNIRIYLKGYRPWECVINVKPNKANVFEKILMVPFKWDHHTIAKGPFTDVSPDAGDSFFVLKKGRKFGEYFLYDRRDNKLYQISRYAKGNLKNYDVNFEFMENDGQMFLLGAKLGEEQRYLVIRYKGGKPEVEDVTGFFPAGETISARWDPYDPESLFNVHGGTVDRIDLRLRESYPGYLEKIKGFGVYRKKIYVLGSDNTVYCMGPDRSEKEILLDDAAISDALFGGVSKCVIDPLPGNIILFMPDDGSVILNRLPYRFFYENVEGYIFYPRTKRAVFWNKGKIGVMDFSAQVVEEDAPFQKGPKFRWVYTGGKDIRQCFWVYAGSHILFRDGNDVFLLDPETSARPRLVHVTFVKDGSSIQYLEDNGRLYYLDPAKGRLESMEIVPERELIPKLFSDLYKHEKREILQ
ncbi:MAG TPA: PEGA domain-containing protein [Candidatus Omnitrophota bacterium]|nr:PEGA domain-containing protein [Candidatus Omnitrophota bacterium]